MGASYSLAAWMDRGRGGNRAMVDGLATQGPLHDAVVVLGAAAVVIPLFHRLRVSPVVGYLLVGLVVGPAGLGAWVDGAPWLRLVTIVEPERIGAVAELGVVLLLFMIGLELSLERILTMRRLVFGLGGLQVAVSAAVVGGVAWALGAGAGTAAVLGVALAMSSTAVVAQVLAEERRVTGLVGRATFSVLLFQDLVVVPVLFVLGAVSGEASGGVAGFALLVGQAALAVAAMVGLGRLVLRPLFRGVAATGSPELFMAACLLVVLGTGLAAAVAGLSMALGALIAGLLLAETEYRRQVEVTVEPFKGLLLGVFLISIGLNFDLRLLVGSPLVVLGAAVALVGVKAAVVAGVGRAFGLRLGVAGPAGLLLGPGGEFGLVMIGLAAGSGLLGREAAGLAGVVVAVTMVAVPGLSWVGRRLFPVRVAPIDPALLPPEGVDGTEVIVAGYGRVGQVVAGLLEGHGVRWIGLDSDVRRVGRARGAGVPVYYGDVSQEALLRAVGLEGARAIVVTIDDRDRADAVVAAVRAVRPGAELLVIVRARDAAHAAALYALGATDAVPETVEASLQLAEAVLVDLGVPMGRVLVSIHERRAAFQAEIRGRAPGAAVPVRMRRRLVERGR